MIVSTYKAMIKNCVITIDPELVDKATANANKKGKSLKNVIEETITTLAGDRSGGKWITEKALADEPWAPSRVTLHQMRVSGRLKEGKHYKRRGRAIYYDKKALARELMVVQK